jgi:hypothetical protein
MLLVVGGFGKDPGYFLVPSAIFIDKKDRIYVSDSANKRIQIFQFLGAAEERAPKVSAKQNDRGGGVTK